VGGYVYELVWGKGEGRKAGAGLRFDFPNPHLWITKGGAETQVERDGQNVGGVGALGAIFTTTEQTYLSVGTGGGGINGGDGDGAERLGSSSATQEPV